MTEEKIIEYAGVGDIAQWCGVSQAAVSKWLERFPTRVPQPDAVIGRDSRRYPAYGWLPESRDRWILFAAGLRDGSVSGYVSPEAAEAEARAEQLAALRQYAQAQRAELGGLEVLG